MRTVAGLSTRTRTPDTPARTAFARSSSSTLTRPAPEATFSGRSPALRHEPATGPVSTTAARADGHRAGGTAVTAALAIRGAGGTTGATALPGTDRSPRGEWDTPDAASSGADTSTSPTATPPANRRSRRSPSQTTGGDQPLTRRDLRTSIERCRTRGVSAGYTATAAYDPAVRAAVRSARACMLVSYTPSASVISSAASAQSSALPVAPDRRHRQAREISASARRR